MTSILEKIQYVESSVCEMANIPPSIHGLNIDVKFNILQPTDKKLNHDPRIKIFKKFDLYNSYYITLNDVKLIHSPKKNFINKKQLNIILKHIKKNKEAYLKLWNEPGMDIIELKRMLK